MTIISIFIIAISLALDSFSVSVANGIKHKHPSIKDAFKVALFFGGFQAFMPLIGWFIGSSLQGFISSFTPWVAFILLSIIGGKMIHESFQKSDEKEKINLLNNKTLLMLSIATSIDALAVGVTLGLIQLPLIISVSVIGIVTFLLCLMGFLLGKKLGSFFEGKVEIIGGIVLVLIGTKILIEYLV